MNWISSLGMLVCLAAPGFAKPPVPRTAAEFRITDASGKQAQLSSYRGKVVLVQFLYTTCVHCQATARMFTKLQQELGPKGLQVVGVAFNSEAQGKPDAVADFVASNQVGFPVGTASMDSVLGYLGVSIMDRFVVPQILVIDRNGMVRAQSEASGTAELQDESYMRLLIEKLLAERQKPRATTTAGLSRQRDRQ